MTSPRPSAPGDAAPGTQWDFDADARLVRRAQAGDRAAAGEIFDRHGRALAGLVQRIMGPNQAVEDVLQEVYIDALRDLGTLREPRTLYRWLRVIAVRRCQRELRGQRRQRRRKDAYREVAGDSGSTAHPRELLEVYRALDDLGPEERIAWTLRHVDGLSVEETARLCACSTRTTKRRVRAAIDKLRRSLEGVQL